MIIKRRQAFSCRSLDNMKNIFVILLMSSSLLFAQKTTSEEVDIGGVKKFISAYVKGKIVYLSAKDLAEKFSIAHFYNPSNQKIELKFSKATLKVTAKNPFVVFAKNNEKEPEVHQMGISTFALRNEIFIPFNYSSKILEKGFEKNISLTGLSKSVEIKPGETASASFNIKSDEKANGTLLTLKSSKEISEFSHKIENNTIELTLNGIMSEALNLKFEKGLIKNVTSQNQPNGTKLFFTIEGVFSSYEIIKAAKTTLLVTVHNKKFVSKESDVKKDKWSFDVIVIDAGHGGKDYGAIGVNNTIEKDVNLSIALKLGELIKKELPEVKIVYTRETDKFVELYKRGKIANEADGKLFISIHCNSVAKKKSEPNGFEIYLLRPGKTDDAISIAERENSVISYEDNPARYQKLTDENFILVSMAHASYMKYSEKFAEMLNLHFKKELKISSRGVKQAGFYVLVGASMPGVLIETGYVTNQKDSDYIKSGKGQNDFARSILAAVKSFKFYYDQVIDGE